MGRYMEALVPDYAMIPEDVYFTNWKNYKMEYHVHSVGGIEFNYVTSGECEYLVEGKCIRLKKRNLLVINSTLPHKLVFTSEEPCLILGMSCGEFPKKAGYVRMRELMEAYPVVKDFLEDLDDCLLIPDGHSFFGTMEDIWAEVRGERNYAYINAECNKLLVRVARHVQNENHRIADYVSQAKMFMNYHYFEIESLDDIAADIGINKIYLQRIFKQYTGETVWWGFTPGRPFTRIFESITGCPPENIGKM